MSDSSIPTLSVRSDRDKIEYVYRQYYPLMRFVAGRVLDRGSSDAEDAVHDAMVKIIRNVGIIDFSDPIRLKNLCAVIARNCATDRLRKLSGKNVPFSEVPEDAADADTQPDQSLIREETLEAILGAIDSLPDVYRDACILKYVHKYKEKEIAALLGIPERTATTRIHRGKMLLREALRKEGYHE